ncbi:MAG: GNAT family N-acetyltransferase [Pseudomonadota bacterium]
MTPASLEFRFAEPADRPGLAALLLALDRHYWGPRDGAPAMAEAAADALLGDAADALLGDAADALLGDASGCRALLAFVDGAPAGLATVTVLHPGLDAAGTLFLKDLYVDEAARGLGLGARFMRRLARHAAELGCRRFDWTAETDNPRALAFYDALGAARVPEKVWYRFAGEDLARLAAEPQDGAAAAGEAP